jgi:hypothetical protein
MAGRATCGCLVMWNTLEMAEEAYIHGNLEVLSLHNIRMAASAMELYPPFHFRKMRLVIKGDTKLGKLHL